MIVDLVGSYSSMFSVKGQCPHPACQRDVYDGKASLDDCYGLPHRCPHCGSVVFVNEYDSKVMTLSLPFEKEIERNHMNPDLPTVEQPYKGRFHERKLAWR